MEKSECWNRAHEFYKTGDFEAARKHCEQNQCSQDVICQRYLGWFYNRQGNQQRAFFWWLKAAEQGDAESCYRLSLIHAWRKEYELAMEYLIRASDGGYHRANHVIGNLYLYGYGFVAPDLEKAKYYFDKSVAHGFLMGERGLLVLRKRQGGIVAKLSFPMAFLVLMCKGGAIGRLNPDDPRLADVPNFFAKKLGLKGEMFDTYATMS